MTLIKNPSRTTWIFYSQNGVLCSRQALIFSVFLVIHSFGELILIGPKTRTPYRWTNEGDVADVEFQDLMSWKALRHKYLFEPMIIIEDEELVEEWNAELGKLYSELQNIDVKALFKLPQRQFVAQLKKLTPGMKSTVQNMAYAMIQDGTLYDLRIIKAIDETLGTELIMMIN